ncbi:MAG: FtsL-like putative cell division protein [Paludibacter sp.]|nr:FtsL-like putative cell division protein [Paludibacter sp.]
MNLKDIVKRIKSNEDFADLKSASFGDFLNGNIFLKNFFRKQYPLFIFISILTFLYIGNRYAYERQLDKYFEKTTQLQDLKYESLCVSSELMKLGRESYIRNLLKNSQLQESTTPVIILEQKK